jgi:hypothetical protein
MGVRSSVVGLELGKVLLKPSTMSTPPPPPPPPLTSIMQRYRSSVLFSNKQVSDQQRVLAKGASLPLAKESRPPQNEGKAFPRARARAHREKTHTTA